jgi:hypothetical protein
LWFQACLEWKQRKVVAHIRELGKAGFAPDGRTVRSIAYRFAVELNLPHRFINEEEMAGHDRLRAFMDRNSDLSMQQSVCQLHEPRE